MSSYQTVVVGTDGSESSLRAVERAAEVAAGARAQLVLVCVYDPVPARAQAVLSRQIADPRFDRVVGREAAEEALEAAARHAERAGASEATAVLAEGDPAQALLGSGGRARRGPGRRRQPRHQHDVRAAAGIGARRHGAPLALQRADRPHDRGRAPLKG
jgi:hypothetical protein